jgi:FMN phosphatase YigB (HAD superfamily)
MINRYPPAATIITFDLHDVLVKHDYKKMLSVWWGCPGRWVILRHLVHPRLLWRVLSLRQQGAVAEHLLMTLLAEFPQLQAYKSTAIAILNAQKPIPESILIVQQLKMQGYTLHLFSNIGEELCQHLKNELPKLFAFFDTIHTTKRAHNYLPKPKKQAFELYLSTYNPTNKHIIFIDNNRKNITQAQEHGIIGILFTGSRNLKKALDSLTLFTK